MTKSSQDRTGPPAERQPRQSDTAELEHRVQALEVEVTLLRALGANTLRAIGRSAKQSLA